MTTTHEDDLHAWNLTADDLQLLWIAQGSTGAGVTLPSGITVRNAATWERLLREAAEIAGR
jgi:hypothetical protein